MRKIFLTLLLLLPALTIAGQDRRLSMDECIELSRQNNPRVANAVLSVTAAQAQRHEARANWFPTVSASAGAFKALNPMVSVGLDDVLGSSDAANALRYYAETMAGLGAVSTEWSALGQGYAAGLSLTQPLYAGGRIATGNALAALGVKAADAQRDLALRQNDDSVVVKYCDIMALQGKRNALEQGISLTSKLEEDVSVAVNAGLARQSDLMQVQLKKHELQAQLVQLQSGVRLARMDLFNLIGLEYEPDDLDSFELTDNFDALSSPDAYRQDLADKAAAMDENRLLDLSVQEKQLQRTMTLGEALPTVGLGASMGYGQLIGEPRLNGMVYALVSVPLTDWTKTSRKLQRAKCAQQQAENDREYLQKQLAVKVGKDWMELQTAWDLLAAARESLALSEKLEAQKRAEYDAGLCTLAELLQTQTELQTTRSRLVDAQSAYAKALAVWK